MSWRWRAIIAGGIFRVKPPAERRVRRGSNFKRLLRRDLLPYQHEWLDDDSRFKIGLWARQTRQGLGGFGGGGVGLHAAAGDAVGYCRGG